MPSSKHDNSFLEKTHLPSFQAIQEKYFPSRKEAISAYSVSKKKALFKNWLQCMEVFNPEKTSVNPKVIIVEATGSVKDARQDLRKAAQQHHGIPVLLVLDTKRDDAEELLSLPASDFHDSNSGEALLKKRINHLSNAPKLPTAVTSTLEFDFLKEEMQLWQSLFENSSTGMLSGDSRPFLSALRQESDKSARGCAPQTFSLADTPLSSVKWELNNQKAQKTAQPQRACRFIKHLPP